MMESGKISNATMVCGACGYALDGLSLNRCPECGQAFDPQDRSTFIVLGPEPQVSGWQRFGRIGLMTGLLLVFSMGYYWAEQGTTVIDGRSSQERIVRMGVPLPWVTWFSATDPSVTAMSPWGFSPGLKLVWSRLGLAVSCLAILAIIFDWSIRFVRRRFPRWRPCPSRPALVVAVLVGLGAGSVPPTDPAWIDIVLIFGLIPICLLIVTWRSRTYGSIVIAAAVAVLSLGWSVRICDLFRSSHLIRKVEIENDLAAPLIFWMLYSFALLFITWLRRAFASPRQAEAG